MAHCSKVFRQEPTPFFLLRGAHRALCPRCARSRLFFTTGSHGSRVLNSAPYSPSWYTREFLF